MLPGLLPNAFEAAVYSCLEGTVNDRHALALQVGERVRVEIQGDPDAWMSEPPAGDHAMNIRYQHVAGVRVPQIVETDATH